MEIKLIQIVGAEQLPLPAYIRQHYCDPDESFYPTPTFTKKQFTRSLKFINWVRNGIEQLWDSYIVGLGVDFALRRGRREDCGRADSGETPADASLDLAAITALDKVRTETDLPLLMQRLENQLQEPDVTAGSQYVNS